MKQLLIVVSMFFNMAPLLSRVSNLIKIAIRGADYVYSKECFLFC